MRAEGKEQYSRAYIGGGTVYPFHEPVVAESTDSRTWTPAAKALDSSAPVVVSALPGTNTLIEAYGVSFNFSAPAEFNTTIVTSATHATSGRSLVVHILPRVAPIFPTGAWGVNVSLVRGVEDRAMRVQLWALSPLSEARTFRVSRLPTSGKLYEIPHEDSDERREINITGDALLGGGRWVLCVPDQDFVGTIVFSYTVTFNTVGLTSEDRPIYLELEPVDDIPVARPPDVPVSLPEDSTGILVRLDAFDPDPGSTVDVLIRSLPSKGRLYLSSDNTLNGTRQHIDASSDIGTFGLVFSQ